MTVNLIGDISFYDMNMYFFIYSFLGWISEVIYSTLKTGEFTNRGFLNGPVCPIYGTGIAFLVLFLNPLKDYVLILFFAGIIFCSVLEFVTGFVLDKIFNTKWWDYSNEHFNVKGYICLKFSIIWGIAVVLVFKALVPITDFLISLISFKWFGAGLLIAFWTVFIADLITTIIQLKRLKKDLTEISRIAKVLHKDSDVIGEKVSEATLTVKNKLSDLATKIKQSRLGKAFPRIIKKFEEIKEEKKKLK